MRSLRDIIPFVLLVLLSGSVTGAQVVLQNETFDGNVDDWILETNSPGFVITLDSAVGSPLPGSLQLTTSTNFADPVLAEALGPCFPVVNGEFIQVQAMVMANLRSAAERCFAFLVRYDSPACTGQRTFVANVPQNLMGVWEFKERGASIGQATRSMRVSLAMTAVPVAGQSTCHFDSVIVTSDRNPSLLNIPTLSARGMILLILTISTLALVFIRCKLPKRT